MWRHDGQEGEKIDSEMQTRGGRVDGGDGRERCKGQLGLQLGMKIYNLLSAGSRPLPTPTPFSFWRHVLETHIISINTSHKVITQAPTFPPA